MNEQKIPFWVGVRKDRYADHDVVQTSEPNENDYPQYDYMIGPFDVREKAEARAKTEKNCTGTFIDPFCNNGKGR